MQYQVINNNEKSKLQLLGCKQDDNQLYRLKLETIEDI